MHDVNNNKAPVNMSNLFQKRLIFILVIHDRLRLESFMLKFLDLKYKTTLFSRLGVKLWNKIPSHITNLPKKAFKRILRKLLLDILEMEDDYIEISLLIKKTRALDTLVKVLITAFLVFFSCHYALFFSKRCINFT